MKKDLSKKIEKELKKFDDYKREEGVCNSMFSYVVYTVLETEYKKCKRQNKTFTLNDDDSIFRICLFLYLRLERVSKKDCKILNEALLNSKTDYINNFEPVALEELSFDYTVIPSNVYMLALTLEKLVFSCEKSFKELYEGGMCEADIYMSISLQIQIHLKIYNVQNYFKYYDLYLDMKKEKFPELFLEEVLENTYDLAKNN